LADFIAADGVDAGAPAPENFAPSSTSAQSEMLMNESEEMKGGCIHIIGARPRQGPSKKPGFLKNPGFLPRC
jgi:hypothetical protein